MNPHHENTYRKQFLIQAVLSSNSPPPASTVTGTLRFGFSESLFADANGDLAGLAAYCGLPLVGATFAVKGGILHLTSIDCVTISIAGAALACLSRSFPPAVEELVKVLLNVCCFIGPTGYVGWVRGDIQLVSCVALFAIAGVVVKPDRHRRLLGVRREDWFHYMIGTASYGMALSLTLM